MVNDVTFLNVYKEPHNPLAVQPLLNWTPPPRSVAIGDFNSVHWAWQPGAAAFYGQGEEIERLGEENNLTCLIIGEPTHKAGNTLDLAWSNITDCCAWVDREECMTSDHLPISGIVPSQKQKHTRHKSPIRVPKDKIPRFACIVSQWVPHRVTLESINDVENFAKDICRVLKDAIKAVGKRSNRGNGKSALWWTPECKAAQHRFRNSITGPERSVEAKRYKPGHKGGHQLL